MATYSLNVAGLHRELPICKVTDGLYIGAFICFGDAELTEACARELLKLVPAGSYLFVLDVHGREMSSEELASRIDGLGLSGRSNLAFLIGGAFGLSREVRAAADERLSFSQLTFTHQMVRLLLVEQIYRAFKINRGEKYHW